jgi:hypothetical protein
MTIIIIMIDACWLANASGPAAGASACYVLERTTMPTLFDPLKLGDLPLPNRIIMAPLVRLRPGETHIPNEFMIEYYRQRSTAARTAIAPKEDFLAYPSTYRSPPKAANENQLAWPLIPFPEGWNAAC